MNMNTALRVLFLANGLMLGSWFTRIPDLQQRFSLDHGQLGLMLLAIVIGNVAALPMINAFLKRGNPQVLLAAALLTALVSLPLAFQSSNVLISAGLLFIFGCAFSAIDLPLNALASDAEAAQRRALMGSMHGSFSIGAFIASLSATVMIGHLTPTEHLFRATLLCTALGMIALTALPRRMQGAGDGETRPSQDRRSSAARGLMLLAFCAALSEGAVGDWSGIFMREVAQVGAQASSLGLMGFSLTMITGRLLGDRLRSQHGNATLGSLGAAVMSLGFALAVFFPVPLTAIGGFMLAGLGLSLLAPLVFSAAGSLGPAIIGLVTSAFYAGFMFGPALVGFAAQISGVRLAFGVPVVLGLIFMYLSAKSTLLLKSRHTIDHQTPSTPDSTPPQPLGT